MTSKYLPGLGPVLEQYDGLILDMWGVIHNGVEPYPGVIACLEGFRQAGKRVIVLSNGPRRAREIADRAAEMGIARSLHDGVMSSGEDCWHHLAARNTPNADPWYATLGDRCYHLGPERDRGMLDGLALEIVDRPADAQFILNTGASAFSDTVETYAEILAEGLSAEVPMICANPDLAVMRGDAMEICAGALAADYADRGGFVRYHGKPHLSVYAGAFKLLGSMDKSRILMVGDGIRTDIVGADRVGIDSALIPGGLHSEPLGITHGEMPDEATLFALCDTFGARPTWVIPSLCL